MARFIVLKRGTGQTVFDFDGEIARIGSGGDCDLRVDAADITGELFRLTRTPSGYELQKMAAGLSLMVNGGPVGERVLLKEGGKITFLDYIIVVTYPYSQQAANAGAIASERGAPPPTPRGADTAPTVAPKLGTPPPAEEKPQQSPAKKGSKPTVVINSESMRRQAEQERKIDIPPPPAPKVKSADTPPIAVPKQPPHIERARPTGKPKITPVYSLVCLSGQHKGMVKEIDTGEYMVGRNPGLCDLVIDHDERGQVETSISREHFVINSTEEGLYLTDKRSKLRTYLNWKVIEPNQREFIAPEDIISIPVPSGEVIFRLCFRDQENFAPPVRPGNKTLRIVIILAATVVLLTLALIWLVRK